MDISLLKVLKIALGMEDWMLPNMNTKDFQQFRSTIIYTYLVGFIVNSNRSWLMIEFGRELVSESVSEVTDSDTCVR